MMVDPAEQSEDLAGISGEDSDAGGVPDVNDFADGLLAGAGRPDVAGSSDPRGLDFVRVRFRAMRAENKALRERIADLEHTLSIIQTAQTWSQGNTMTPEQAQKVKEVTVLLHQAKQARQEAMNFSKVGKGELYEKLRSYKNMLRRERQEKREMKERLVNAFEHARIIKDQNKRLLEKQHRERHGWQQLIRNVKEKQRVELQQLKDELGSQSASKLDRMRQLSQFGERVMRELGALQEHLQEVRQETVDNVLLEDDDEFEDGLLGRGAGPETGEDGPPSSAPAGVSRGNKQTPLPRLSPEDKAGGFFITQNF